jgi:hypothetical protein
MRSGLIPPHKHAIAGGEMASNTCPESKLRDYIYIKINKLSETQNWKAK